MHIDAKRFTVRAVQISDMLEAEGFSDIEIHALLSAGIAWAETRMGEEASAICRAAMNKGRKAVGL